MQVAKFLRPVVLSIILYSSHARTFSLIHGYSAPIEIYKLLEHHDDVANGKDQTFGGYGSVLGLYFFLV
jgi:alpha-1,2-mannosyltransferase